MNTTTATRTVSYTAEPGRKGWNVVRWDSETHDMRVVDSKHSEHAAWLRADQLAGKR